MEPLQAHILRTALFNATENSDVGQQQQTSKHLVVRAPLDAYVFEVALSHAFERQDFEAVRRLADFVIERKPRSLAARLLHFKIGEIDDDPTKVIAAHSALSKLGTTDQQTIDQALVGVFRERDDWSELLTHVESLKPKGAELIELLLEEDIDAFDLQEVVVNYPSVQGSFLKKLMNERDFELARLFWSQYTDIALDEQETFMFNGKLEDREEPPPFNWELLDNRIEFQSSGGVHISYMGSEGKRLMRQVLRLPPDQYSLVTVVAGRMSEGAGNLEWVIRCMDDRTKLHAKQIQLKKVQELETVQTQFLIASEDCAFQTIELWGRPGEFPKRSSIQIISVELHRVNK